MQKDTTLTWVVVEHLVVCVDIKLTIRPARRRVVAPIIDTLLMVAITVVGGIPLGLALLHNTKYSSG